MTSATHGAQPAADVLEVHSPLTGELIGHVPCLGRDQVMAAAARARAAQPAWEALGVRARVRFLRAWADLLWERRADMIRTIRSETGKNETGALSEVFGNDFVTIYCYHRAPRVLRSRSVPPLFPIVQRARVTHKAYGLVGVIAPWNYPLLLVFAEVVPALCGGNAVLIKPSELTPHTALLAVELLHQVGVPRDVVQVITGDGVTGAALIDAVDFIHVTGSTATGRRVAQRAAERMIPCSLELGSKDPLIVLRDSDLDLAATGAIKGAFENAGQACVSTERVYVEEAVYEPFVERVLHHTAGLRVGAQAGLDVHMGSLTHEREVKRVEAHIADALAKGARVIAGGRRRPDLGPYFFDPTILVDVDHSMEVMREETFGPILPIMRVRDAEEAVRLANDNAYGLSASIYTRSLRRAEALARRIQTGDVAINRTGLVTIGTPTLPTGGEKASGLGRRNGDIGLLRFVKTQSIMTDLLLYNPASSAFFDPLTLFGLHIIRLLRRWLPI